MQWSHKYVLNDTKLAWWYALRPGFIPGMSLHKAGDDPRLNFNPFAAECIVSLCVTFATLVFCPAPLRYHNADPVIMKLCKLQTVIRAATAASAMNCWSFQAIWK